MLQRFILCSKSCQRAALAGSCYCRTGTQIIRTSAARHSLGEIGCQFDVSRDETFLDREAAREVRLWGPVPAKTDSNRGFTAQNETFCVEDENDGHV